MYTLCICNNFIGFDNFDTLNKSVISIKLFQEYGIKILGWK
jgi:hypothetical protein